MRDETINKYLPVGLSEKDRLRRALEFIDLIEQGTDPRVYEAVWEEALGIVKSRYCEQCGIGLLLGKPTHVCLLAACPNQKRLILPG